MLGFLKVHISQQCRVMSIWHEKQTSLSWTKKIKKKIIHHIKLTHDNVTKTKNTFNIDDAVDVDVKELLAVDVISVDNEFDNELDVVWEEDIEDDEEEACVVVERVFVVEERVVDGALDEELDGVNDDEIDADDDDDDDDDGVVVVVTGTVVDCTVVEVEVDTGVVVVVVVELWRMAMV